MRVAIMIIGAVAILSYIVGMFLAAGIDPKDPDAKRERIAASLFIIFGWLLISALAFLGAHGTESVPLAVTAWVAVLAPLVGAMFRRVKWQWIPAICLLTGLLAAPVLYVMLLLK